MKIKISVIPVTFTDHGGYIWNTSDPDLATAEVDVSNTIQLMDKLAEITKPLQDSPYLVSMFALSRKFRGFDKWEFENKASLRNNPGVTA